MSYVDAAINRLADGAERIALEAALKEFGTALCAGGNACAHPDCTIERGMALAIIALRREVTTLTRERDEARRDGALVDAARQSITRMRTPSLCCDGENRDYIIGFKSGYAEARDDAVIVLDAARTADAGAQP